MNARQRHRARGIRLGRVLIAIWKGDVCHRCHHRFPPEQLELHHRPGTEKRFKIAGWSRYATCSLDTLVAELRKTEPLCAACHQEEHREAHRRDAALRPRDTRGRFVRAA